MPRSGGVMTLTGSDFVAGNTILSSEMNAKMDDIADEITNSVAKDGQTSMTGTLPMNNNRISGVNDPTSLKDAVNAQTVMTQGTTYVTDWGTADTYAITLAPAVSALTAGQRVQVKIGAGNTSTGASTLNTNSLGAVDIKKLSNSGKVDTVADDLVAGLVYDFIYDGTDWVLQSPVLSTANIQTMIDNAISTAKSALFPVGSYYINENDATNPGTLLGFGTWTAVSGRMLIGQGDGNETPTITGCNASNDTVTISSSVKLYVGQLVKYFDNGGSIAGLTDNTQYYIAGEPTANNYTLATNTKNAQMGVLVNITVSSVTGSPYLETQDGTWTLGQVGGHRDRLITKSNMEHEHNLSKSVDAEGSVNNITNASLTSGIENATASPTLMDVMSPYKVVYIWRRTA